MRTVLAYSLAKSEEMILMLKCRLLRAVVLVLMLSFAMTATAYGSLTQKLAFPDSQLEKAVRRTAGKASGALTHADVKALVELDASGRGISNLRGIEALTSLTVLGLMNNRISNAAPLSKLTKLTVLDLRNNKVRDFSPVAKIKGVRR